MSAFGAVEDAPDPVVLEQERHLKEDAEQKAQIICDNVLGKGLSSVLVNVELGLETSRRGGSNLNQKRDNKSGLGDDSFILPWVPAPKSVTKEEVPKDASLETQAVQTDTVDIKTVVKRFDITVLHDKTIPKERVEEARSMLESAFDRYKNILKLFFKESTFVHEDKDGFNAKDAVKKSLFDWLKPQHIILFLLLLLLMSLLKFFFGPLAEFMKNYIEGMKELNKSKVEMDTKTENETETDEEQEEIDGEQELTPEELAALEAEEEAMRKFEPFKYVTDENIKQLAYLLHHEEPWIVAMVISYLSADHAFKVMDALPGHLQAKVALETAMYRQTSLEQVVAIDEDIKQKIDFVVGGLEKLVVILESSDRLSRDNILEHLRNEKPAVYERVRERIVLFEDMAAFPKLALQTVVRELKNEQLARALRGAGPELQQKFFENMSQGAVTLVKEEMEYGRPVTDEQIEEERKKILDLIKVMETEGKIAFRQKGKIGALSGDEMTTEKAGMSLGPGGNPEAALAAYNNGAAAQEAGDLDEAIRQFEAAAQSDPQVAAYAQSLGNAYYAAGRYPEALAAFDAALALEPNEELRVWVESVRASLSAGVPQG
jgi:flagellar motor switch protein FliG